MDKKRKILLSAYGCAPGKGSELGNGWNWALELTKLNHEVWCFTTYRFKEEIKAELNKNPVRNLHFVFIDVPKLYTYLYRWEFGVYLHYLKWQKLALARAKFMHKKINFDLVHHVTYGSLQLGSGLWALKLPLIFGPVGGGQFAPKAFKSYIGEGWDTEWKRKLMSELLTRFNRNTRQTIKKAQTIYVTNSETAHIAKKLKGRDIKFLLDTSLPKAYFPKKMPERFRGNLLKILWVGRIMPRKGLPLVLEALSEVKDNIPFKFTVIGYGTHAHLVPEWISKYNMGDHVDFLGKLSWAEVKQAYLDHHVFMFTSLRDSCPPQLLEAMAHGLPIITLNIHGSKHLVPEGAGIKVNVTDPERTVKELSESVIKIYGESDKLYQYGYKGYEFAKTQNWPDKVRWVSDHYPK